MDGDGVVHLVYGESPTGRQGSYRIRYTRSTDSGVFVRPATLSEPVPEPHDNVNFPGLAVDGDNNLYVLMHLAPGPRQRPRTLAVSVSINGGETFTPPSPVAGISAPEQGITGSLQGLLVRKLAANRAGRGARRLPERLMAPAHQV